MLTTGYRSSQKSQFLRCDHILTIMKVIRDLAALPGKTFDEKAHHFVQVNDVAILSKSFCPLCHKAKLLLDQHKIEYALVDVDKIDHCRSFHGAIKTMTKHKTVPVIIVKGQLIGGYQELLARCSQPNGAETLFTGVQRRTGPPPRHHAHVRTWFGFPDTVNGWVVKYTAMQTSALAAASVLLGTQPVAIYLTAFLTYDYTVRMVGKSNWSLLGMVAQQWAASRERDIRPGASKQFASFCGTAFSSIAFASFLSKNDILGSVVIGILAVCAGMEAYLDFCFGCFCFDLGLRIQQYFFDKIDVEGKIE